MKVSTRFAGTPLKPCSRTVSWRDTMNYAAAVDDDNPAFFDDEAETGVIAPPMFSVAATWPISENLPEFIQAADFPFAAMQRQVHYTEHLEFHAPIAPGVELEINGSICAIAPHPAGTYIVIRYDAADRGGGKVFTEHVGGLLRGVECDGPGAGTDALPVPHRFGEPGGTLWSSRVKIDPLRPYIYDGCARIYFPIHTSRKFARKLGLPGIILQGTATLAFAVREITNVEASGRPESVAAVSCRFTGMVFPGNSVIVRVTRRENEDGVRHVSFDVLDDEGKYAVSDGYVRLNSSR
ncbi:MAG TPA: MaoC/PaaZ C-terminal domain-containing protein [Syntrophales bacterium]|nr:MaoC/PaaZ C-terminal domain-containing protein [Syntrophales bacterium]